MARPKLSKFRFDLKYTAAKPREIRQNAAKLYGRLLSDAVSVEAFIAQLKESRTTDPKLFACMISFLVKEFNFLNRHSLSNVDKFSDLVAALLAACLFPSDVKGQVFGFLKSALREGERTMASHFAIRILNAFLPRLNDEPQFFSDIAEDTALRALDTPLFEKIQRLVQKPAKSSVAKTLIVHPLLKRFDSLQSPPPRVCKAVQLIQKDPSTIVQFLSVHEQHSEWLALHIVKTMREQPTLAQGYIAQVNEAKRFWRAVFQAAASQALSIIQSPKVDTCEGAAIRRRLSILGCAIGRLTVARDRPVFSISKSSSSTRGCRVSSTLLFRL
jgi:CCR4-NOT transcription complex subunit 1